MHLSDQHWPGTPDQKGRRTKEIPSEKKQPHNILLSQDGLLSVCLCLYAHAYVCVCVCVGGFKCLCVPKCA